MENTQPTFKEIRKFLKPWMNINGKYDDEPIVKIFNQNNQILVKVSYEIIYDKNHKHHYIHEQATTYLTKAGFSHNGYGTFKRKINLVD